MSQPVLSSDEEALLRHAHTGRSSCFLRCATTAALATGVMAAVLLATGLRLVLTGHGAASLGRSSSVAEPPEAAGDADAGSAAEGPILLQGSSNANCPIDTSGPDFFTYNTGAGNSVFYCYTMTWPEEQSGEIFELKITIPRCICDTYAVPREAFVMKDCEQVTDSFTVLEFGKPECGVSFKCSAGSGEDDDHTGGACPQPGETHTFCFEVEGCPGICGKSDLWFPAGGETFGSCLDVPGPCCGSCPVTPFPTSTPTPAPTAAPSPAPTTATPPETPAPTSTPSPTSAPTPTAAPTSTPTVLPTASPTPSPTTSPGLPTAAPTPRPTRPPTAPNCNVPCSLPAPTGLGLGASPPSLGPCFDGNSRLDGECIEPDQCGGGGEDDDDGADRRLTSGRTCEIAWEEIQRNASHTGSNPNATIPCDNMLQILYHTCSPLCFFCHYC